MKKMAWILSVGLALFLVVNFIAGFVSPDQWAFDTAQSELVRRGFDNDHLSHPTSNVTSNILGSTAIVTSKAKDTDTSKIIRVTLRKTGNLLRWQVVDYDER
jgi:hypothetical protein